VKGSIRLTRLIGGLLSQGIEDIAITYACSPVLPSPDYVHVTPDCWREPPWPVVQGWRKSRVGARSPAFLPRINRETKDLNSLISHNKFPFRFAGESYHLYEISLVVAVQLATNREISLQNSLLTRIRPQRAVRTRLPTPPFI
jgi:hypothetical protein